MSANKKTPPAQLADELPDGSVFRTAFESSRAVMFLVDPETARIIGANAAACEFYGYHPDEVADVSATQVSLLSSERIRELFHSLSSGGAARFASRPKLKSGELRDMELDAAPILLPGGRSCLFFIGHDITERKQAERALRRSEGLLRAILASAGDGIAFKDTNGVYREVNPAFCRMAGLPCEDILEQAGGNFFDLPSDGAAATDSPAGDSASRSYELTQAAPGGPRHLSVHKSPVFDFAGECLGEVSISRDITERRNAEAALFKSEGLLRAMLQSAQDSIYVTDESDVLRELNQTFCTQVGRPREELLASPWKRSTAARNCASSFPQTPWPARPVNP